MNEQNAQLRAMLEQANLNLKKKEEDLSKSSPEGGAGRSIFSPPGQTKDEGSRFSFLAESPLIDAAFSKNQSSTDSKKSCAPEDVSNLEKMFDFHNGREYGRLGDGNLADKERRRQARIVPELMGDSQSSPKGQNGDEKERERSTSRQDNQDLKINLTVPLLPSVKDFKSWMYSVKKEIQNNARNPNEALVWIGQVEVAQHYSNLGMVDRYQVLDSKLNIALNRRLYGSMKKAIASIDQTLMQYD